MLIKYQQAFKGSQTRDGHSALAQCVCRLEELLHLLLTFQKLLQGKDYSLPQTIICCVVQVYLL